MASGRYDSRLKVYKNGNWYNAKRVRVYKNGWVDLGTDQSDNTKSLYVRKGSSYIRVTRNKNVTPRTVTVNAGYQQRETNLNTVQQWCFNYRNAASSSGVTKTKFYAIMYVKLAAGQSSRLFSFNTSSYFEFYAGIRSDGTVYFNLKDEYFAASSSPWNNNNAARIQVGFDKDWQKIEFIGNIGSDIFTVKVNDVATNFARHTAWDARSFGGSTGKVGGPNLRIAKDSSHAFKIDTANAPFTSLVDESTTTTVYDTTWV